jgi:molybdate transport system substrate-binding protein
MTLFRATIFGLLLLAAPTAARAGESISVAVAISLKEAMGEIATAYTRETGDEVRFTFGASGQLAAQIRNGAPVDAFISAAGKQIDELIEAGQLDRATRCEVAGNALVLVVPAAAEAADGPASFGDLADPNVRRVAVGEPKSVPAGLYAMRVMEKLGVAKTLAGSGRLVYGANVRQVLDYVARGEVAAGVVYATDARQAGEDAVRVVATAEPGTHDPIVYPAAVVASGNPRRAAAATRFLEYLKGDGAKRILKARGFTIPGDDVKQGDGDEPPAAGKAGGEPKPGGEAAGNRRESVGRERVGGR